jgi:hypothetical protein
MPGSWVETYEQMCSWLNIPTDGRARQASKDAMAGKNLSDFAEGFRQGARTLWKDAQKADPDNLLK